jgi:predicted ATP-grasp superfamily ATP-dependent carboligase
LQRTADVLVIDAGDGHGRSALAGVRALAAAGYRPLVGTYGAASLAAASRYCAQRIELPPPNDQGFVAAVESATEARGAVALLPASDASLRALDRPGSHFVDKTNLAVLAREAGVPMPLTQTFASGADLVAAAGSLPYPIVVKPSVPVFPARRFDDASQVAALSSIDVELLVQPFLVEQLRAVAGVVWRGRLVSAVHQRTERTWPADCGTASAAVSVEPDVTMEAAVLRLLGGYEGLFQAQFAGDMLLDLNPRLYGSMPLAVAAGANLPGVYCDLVRGEDVPTHRARAGVRYRWLEGDLRNLSASLRGRRGGMRAAARALFPRRGSAHSVESLRDPGPMLARLRFSTRRR